MCQKKTIPGGWSCGWVGGRVVVLNENITTSAPNWAWLGAELGNKQNKQMHINTYNTYNTHKYISTCHQEQLFM